MISNYSAIRCRVASRLARVTCDRIASRDRIHRPTALAAATACRSPRSPPPTARRSTSTARRRSPSRYRAIDEAFAALSARDPLRAEGELDAGDRAAAARPRQRRRRELRRRDRRRAARRLHPAADRLHRRRQDARRSSSRRSISASRPINAESAGELERIDAIARARADAHAASRCASIRTSTRGATRTSRPASRPTSSASPLDDVRDDLPRTAAARPGSSSSACTATSDRRSPTSIRCAAPREALVTLARELRDDGITHRAPRSRRRPRHLVRRTPRADGGGLRRRRCLPAVRDSGLAIILEPGRSIVGARRRAADARRRREGAAGRQGCSSSSTPA